MRAVNLIPAEERGGAPVGAGRSEGGAYALLALLAGIAVMAFLYGKAHHDVTSRTAQAASLSARAQQAQQSASQLAPYANFIALRQQRTQAVEQLVDTRFDWAHVFHEFGRVLPSDASITSISGAVGASTVVAPVAPAAATTATATAAAAAPVASATPAGSVPTFTVAGCATSQEAVAQTIDRLRLIDGVSAVTLQSSAAGSGSGGATGGGQCTATGPVFTLAVTFDALPTPSARTVAPTATTVPAADVSGGVATTQGSNR
jgi:Tfp pilus assembly protein PilN